MTENSTKPSRKRLYWRAAIGSTILCMFLAAGWYVRSARFRDFVRARIVSQIEDTTGGRVEIAHLEWNLSKLEIEARDLTVHGLEGPNDIPYIHAERVYVKGKVGSLFHRALGFRYFELDRPIVHIIVYPDGGTNQPRPKLKRANERSPVQTLFDFSINKADIKDGKLLINDQPTPFDFTASELAGTMMWFKPANRYDCVLHAGKIDTKFEGMRPFSAGLDTQFSFWPNAAEVKSLTIVSGRSRMEASVRLDDFLKPNVTLKYRARIDLAETGSVTRIQQLRDGMMNVEGHGVYSASSSFITSGRASIQGLEWKETWVQVPSVAAAVDFAIDKKRFKIEHIVAHLIGGTATGDVVVDNWLSPLERERRGTVSVQAVGLRSSGVAAAFSSRSLPLDVLKPAGTAGGSVGVTWSGAASNAVTSIDAAATPPTFPVTGQLPVSATLRGAYRSKADVLDVASLTLVTPATQIRGTGVLGRTATNLHATATTGDLGEFAPLIAATYGVKVPIELHGHASFEGTVSGAIVAPTVAGHLQVTDFNSDADFLQPGQRAGLAKRMHWDVLSTNFQYGPTLAVVHNGVLRHDGSQLGFDGTAQLARGKLTRTSPFAAKLTVHDAQISDLQAMAGYEYPVTGIIDVNMQISGTQDAPRGSGHALIRGAVVYGQPVNQIKSDIAFVNSDARFENVMISEGSGHISGSGSYNATSRAYGFLLRGANLAIRDIKEIQNQRLNATGLLNFTAEGHGTPSEPVINADVALNSVVLDSERVGDLAVSARSVGEVLKVTARSRSEKGSVEVDGTVRLRDDFPASAIVRLSHVDLDPFLRVYATGRLTGHSSFGGAMDVRGSLRNWRKLQLTGELSELFLPVENVDVRNQGPIRFAVADQVLNLQQFHVIAEGTDFSATGSLQFVGEQKVDLQAEGRVNLKIIQSFNPDFTSYGLATVNLRVGGDLQNPRSSGRIQIANAGISHIDLPNGLSEINGSLVFNRDRVQVQNLTARTGGGSLNVNGYVTYGRTVGFNLQGVGNDIRLRYPQGVSSNANANIKLTGSPNAALVSGDIVVTKFGITPQFDLATYIARSKQPTPVPKPDSLLYNVKMDVHVTSTPELQVQTALAKISGNVDLRLRGSLARPAVLGRVNIVEGDVSFNGTKYHVERGDISFANPTGITPVFDIAANTRVRDYDITLGFHGSTERGLNTTYRSDPPLATADIIALLAFGRTREESALQSTANRNLTEEASNAILGQAVNATVSSRMQKLFGVSRIKIDPEVGGAENNPSSARVTVEQQVAKNLTVTYITDIARSNQQIISMEYNVTRAVSIVAVRDQYGIVSFDVRVRQRKK